MSPSSQDSRRDDPLEEEAYRYFARERSGEMTASEAAEMDAWLKTGTSHAETYQAIADAWSDIEELRSDPSILAMRENALTVVLRRRRWRFALQSAAAAILVGLSLGGSWWVYDHRAPASVELSTTGQRYATRTGERASVALADGSLAILDSDSAIRSSIGASGLRKVQLLSGRAMFTVAKNPQRKFTVEVGNTLVTAVGTRFDVYRKAHGVEVNLVEGHLRVEPPPVKKGEYLQADRVVEMIAGDRLIVGPDGWHLTKDMAEREINWTMGQLVFDNAPIGTVVNELNRYSKRKLVLVGDVSAAPPISAVIRTSDPLMFLSAVEAMGIAHSRETPSGYEIILQ